MTTNYKSQLIDGYLEYFFRKKLYVKKQFEFFYVCMHHGPVSSMLFVIGEDDNATTCAFSRGCCKVSETAVKAVSGGLPHSRKYYFLNIIKTNIPLRCKENIIDVYFYYFNYWFMQSDSKKHWKTLIGLLTCPKNNCAI